MRQCCTLTSTSPEPSVLVFIARFLLSWGCSSQSKFLHIIRGASPQRGEQVTGNEVNSAAQVESFSSLQNRILTMCQWMNTFSVPIHSVLCQVQPTFLVPLQNPSAGSEMCVCREFSVASRKVTEWSSGEILCTGSWDCLILVFPCVFVGE